MWGGGRGLQRSGEIREGGYSEELALPWAAHIHAHINTPEEHTQTHTQMSKYSHKA